MIKAGYTPFKWRRRTPNGFVYVSTWPMDIWVLTRLCGKWSVCRRKENGEGYSLVMVVHSLQHAIAVAEEWEPKCT